MPVERALATATLGPASLAWGLVGAARNTLFDLGVLRSHRVEGAQVVSVGNVVVGGSGKTPVVIFLARWASAAGKRVAVLSRGFGRRSSAPLEFERPTLPNVDECGDEPRLIARSTSATVFVDADRVAAARRARAQGFEVLLLDDGFQHRRLGRDVDLVIHVPGASTAVLPLGPCREFAHGVRRASLVWNGPAATDPTGRLRVSGLRGLAQELRGKKVIAVAGIARPERFFETVRALGAELVATKRFPDHHRFSPRELAQLQEHAAREGALLVTTAKDAERLEGVGLVVVETELEVTRGLDTLARVLGWPLACAPRPSVGEAAP